MKHDRLAYLADEGIADPRVLAAVASVPREAFVPAAERARAYENTPLPIGRGQTISQPYVVAFMTQELEIRRGDRVLEIGTGSGYQAAVLAELGADVFSVEIIPSLAASARSALDATGYGTVHTRTGNGRNGWPEEAPFDRIVVTAAAATVPPALKKQLADGGTLVMPVGEVAGVQELVRIRRTGTRLDATRLLSVRFVPLTGDESG